MPVLDTINRAFRDYVRFTGDGLPGAPTGAPLPLGDPRSGVHNLSKAEIRQALIEVAQSLGDPDALQTIIAELDGKADRQNSGKVFTRRSAAVEAGQSALPGSLGIIFTVEGVNNETLAVRSFNNATDDPLFATQPRWGVALRLPASSLLDAKASTEDLAPVAFDGLASSVVETDTAKILTDVERESLDSYRSGVLVTDDIILERAGLSVATVASGLRLWLEANRTDGGPTAHSAELIGTALQHINLVPTFQTWPGVSAALTAGGLQTFLTAGDVDGSPTDFSAELIGMALNRIGWGANIQSVTDMSRFVAWGSSTIEYLAGDFSNLAADYGAVYHDGGDASVTANVILARMGVTDVPVTFPNNTIPASGTVAVTVGGGLPVYDQILPWRGICNGVEGILSVSGGSWRFERVASGPSITVSGAVNFQSLAGMRERYSLNLFNIGKNDLAGGSATAADTAIAATRAAVQWLPAADRRFIIMGHYVNHYTPASSTVRTAIETVNASQAAEFGGKFIDLGAYVTSAQIWTDTGVTPTQTDLDQQALGNLPPSLAKDSLHMNAAANTAVTRNLIEPRLNALGWWN